ncbi:hypothetical protein FHS83_001876 [Rhizomicrobium palustre]|uniref:Uncharacterized protein n=1 Tax=Rhizomicrobium palustre TaxID=189966 RepID=A0A846MY71_9PROT|nr:hypothetical protein [Rhizomicrobium palustre]NIK88558.1 hypothetical protein [Rhizomicrobium palustre]
MGTWAGVLALVAVATAAQAQDSADAQSGAAVHITLPDGRVARAQAVPEDRGNTQAEASPADILRAASAGYTSGNYIIRATRWSENDEKEYSQFIAELGESGCTNVNRCLHDPRNPYRGSDPAGLVFRADCADLPYYLRFYFAWKRGLPFSFANEVEPRGRTRDMRYTAAGNRVASRLFPAGYNGYAVLDYLRDVISSASYRIHPELESPQQDFYSPVISTKSIRPGTVVYDPNGHLITVWKVERNGRIHYMDAHPDYSVTRGFYDVRFVRSSPGMGAGFKNWRPQILEGATRQADGSYTGGRIVMAANKAISDYSLEQFFGNGKRPAEDRDWASGGFTLNGERIGYYDYVRGQLAGGTLLFDPLREIGDMVDSNCDDLKYRGAAVDLAIAAGIQKRAQPDQLPANIYGTEGDWEMYSSPSRDARLKTAFKETYETTRRFVEMAKKGDTKLSYKGKNIAADMLAVYDAHAARCTITYQKSDGSKISFGYEDARRRLFEMSFDPYHCIERRWGAKGDELKTCQDGSVKQAWYEAERPLRNQIDRAYDTRMDFTLSELKQPGPGRGIAAPPETDVRSWLVREARTRAARR